jgi:hypothetical protein
LIIGLLVFVVVIELTHAVVMLDESILVGQAGTLSDGRKYPLWVAWAALSLTTAAVCLWLMLTILLNRKLRANSFNQFVIGLVFPDFAFAFLCGVTCWRNAAVGHYFGAQGRCLYQGVFVCFGFTASVWMNLAISGELLNLLKCLKVVPFRPYVGPSRLQVALRVACVYTFSLGLSLMLAVPGIPVAAKLGVGLACVM